MSEFLRSNQFDPIEDRALELASQYNTLIRETGTTPDSQSKRQNAMEELADAITTESIGEQVATKLIDFYFDGDPINEDHHVSLYAFTEIIGTAVKTHPKGYIPVKFILFTESLAKSLEEKTIEQDLHKIGQNLIQLARINQREIETDKDEKFVEGESDPIFALEDVFNEGQIGFYKFYNKKLYEFEEFEVNSFYEVDRKRLGQLAQNLDKLYELIVVGYFYTKGGENFARAHQDLLRLDFRQGDPYKLILDIEEGKFLTDEGESMANIQNDLERLKDHENSAIELRVNIETGKFLTKAGLAAANKVLENLES